MVKDIRLYIRYIPYKLFFLIERQKTTAPLLPDPL